MSEPYAGLTRYCTITCAAGLTSREEETIEREIVEEAAILTGIGVGTAIGLLLLLVIVIALIGWLGRRYLGWAAPAGAIEEHVSSVDKARAAAIAVTALRERRSVPPARLG